MKYECTYDPEQNIVVAVTHGVASLDELINMEQQIVDLLAKEKTANILVDHSEVDASLVTMSDVDRLSQLVALSKDILTKRKCAHVAANDLEFGLVRAWEIFVEMKNIKDFSTRAFRSKVPTLEWLKTGS
jgi:hypothetical protein